MEPSCKPSPCRPYRGFSIDVRVTTNNIDSIYGRDLRYSVSWSILPQTRLRPQSRASLSNLISYRRQLLSHTGSDERERSSMIASTSRTTRPALRIEFGSLRPSSEHHDLRSYRRSRCCEQPRYLRISDTMPRSRSAAISAVTRVTSSTVCTVARYLPRPGVTGGVTGAASSALAGVTGVTAAPALDTMLGSICSIHKKGAGEFTLSGLLKIQRSAGTGEDAPFRQGSHY